MDDCRRWELGERGGVRGRWPAGWNERVSMCSVVGSPQVIFRTGFSTTERVGQGRPGKPYWQVEVWRKVTVWPSG